MHFRKERALALLTGHGAGLILSGQAFGNAMQNGCEVLANAIAGQTGVFGLGVLGAYLALSQAGEAAGDKNRFRLWELASGGLFAIIVLTLSIGGFTDFWSPASACRVSTEGMPAASATLETAQGQ